MQTQRRQVEPDKTQAKLLAFFTKQVQLHAIASIFLKKTQLL